ncbi:MAG: hypothetical protein P1T08_12690 [Acidimicrobiia bacterium]|nr:hypothetical protein [Acidimicrobiia bacterium]
MLCGTSAGSVSDGTRTPAALRARRLVAFITRHHLEVPRTVVAAYLNVSGRHLRRLQTEAEQTVREDADTAALVWQLISGRP